MTNEANVTAIDILPTKKGDVGYLPPHRAKVIADRYFQKDGKLKKGALVVAIMEAEMWGKIREVRELGKVVNIKTLKNKKKKVEVKISDNSTIIVDEEKIDVLREKTPNDMWTRIATGVTKGMTRAQKERWIEEFIWLLEDFNYVPGGRINASMGAVDENGNPVKTTSYNCFVIPNVGPMLEDIATSFGRSLEIQARSGGVGMNMSFVQPQGSIVEETKIKRNNMQLVMDIWHPDVFNFLEESGLQDIENPYGHSFKTVRLNKAFRDAVEKNEDWVFEFPNTKVKGYDDIWDGDLTEWKKAGYETVTYETMPARDVMEKLIDGNVSIVDGVFAKPVIPGDSRDTIASALTEVWQHLVGQRSVAVMLSSLRPKNARVLGVNGRSSGAYSWGALYDRANWAFSQGFGPVAIADIMSIGCLLTLQGGSRRGALMIILNDWHQDIRKFIAAKQDEDLINGANISVGISDSFMEAKKEGLDWATGYVKPESFHQYDKAYSIKDSDFIQLETVKASDIWGDAIKSAHSSAEPGVVFIERFNKYSNSHYYAPLIATNPCGEQPLPGYGICNLGAVNLARVANGWIDRPSAKHEFENKKLEAHIKQELLQFFDEEKATKLLYHINWEQLERITRVGLRFQDAVIDATYYPFEENEKQQKGERRVGLGIMGLHDLMLYCGIQYGEVESEHFSDVVMGMIAEWCYLESTELAKENGPFETYVEDEYLKSEYMKNMAKRKPHVIEEIKKYGVRNVTTMTIAPTGTTGTMVGVSTGCEPYFAFEYLRNSRVGSFMEKAEIVQEYFDAHPDEKELPDYFITANKMKAIQHIRVQAALQRWVDSSISKTTNAPSTFTVEDTNECYEKAYELGLKGMTIYVDQSRGKQVLENVDKEEEEEVVDEKPKYKKKKRNNPLYGATYQKRTPMGPAYITINDDLDEGNAREIFVNIGKAGSDVFAANEALGRMITLYLKDSPNPNKEAVLVKHLSGIGGQNAVGFGPNRILSVPDAIAKALIEHAETFPLRHLSIENSKDVSDEKLEKKEPVAAGVKEEKQDLRKASASLDLCPECGQMSLMSQGGCNECTNCGYSKC